MPSIMQLSFALKIQDKEKRSFHGVPRNVSSEHIARAIVAKTETYHSS